MRREWWVCSDLHNGPEGHPATDATPGWRGAWAAVPEPKLRLGDMDETWQFTPAQLDAAGRAGTDVDGNHDARRWWRDMQRIGDTIFLHGHQFDSWLVRLLARPVTWLVGKLERRWPDLDVRAGNWLTCRLLGGRYGEQWRYVSKAAAYARKRGATQVVFGHLHGAPFRSTRGQIRVVGTGCCVGGRMDFVAVEVVT